MHHGTYPFTLSKAKERRKRRKRKEGREKERKTGQMKQGGFIFLSSESQARSFVLTTALNNLSL